MELSDKINQLSESDRLKLLMYLSELPSLSDELLGKLIMNLDTSLTDAGITPEIWTSLEQILSDNQSD